MANPILISLICEECFGEEQEIKEFMRTEGNLAVNRENSSQSQKYICPNCKKEVLVILEYS